MKRHSHRYDAARRCERCGCSRAMANRKRLNCPITRDALVQYELTLARLFLIGIDTSQADELRRSMGWPMTGWK